MPRTARRDIVTAEGLYHVIVRGNDRRVVFRKALDYQKYLMYIRAAKAKHGVAVLHFVLMPNHVHFLVRPAHDLEGFMHAVQLAYAKHFRVEYGHSGHVWQDRYKSLVIDNDAYAIACGNYIEMNPVRAGLVARPEEWRHSSYRHYAFGERSDLVDTDPYFRTLGRTVKERQREYRSLLAMTRSS